MTRNQKIALGLLSAAVAIGGVVYLVTQISGNTLTAALGKLGESLQSREAWLAAQGPAFIARVDGTTLNLSAEMEGKLTLDLERIVAAFSDTERATYQQERRAGNSLSAEQLTAFRANYLRA